MNFSVAVSIKEKRGRNRKSTFCTIALLGTKAPNTVFQKLINRPLLRREKTYAVCQGLGVGWKHN